MMRMTWCRESIGDARSNSQGFDWSNLYSEVDCLVNQFLQKSMGLLTFELPSVAQPNERQAPSIDTGTSPPLKASFHDHTPLYFETRGIIQANETVCATPNTSCEKISITFKNGVEI